MPTNFSRRTVLTSAAALLAAPALRAQGAWPAKPIRAVIGFAPGGGVDNMVRTIAPGMGELLGQPLVIDNKPGASGNTAAADVARAQADGYTILFAPLAQQSINPFVIKNSPDMAKEMTPVALVGRNKLHLVVKKDLPVNNLKELVELAKSRPGKLNFASSGVATSPHLLHELFLKEAGVSMVHVPYKGSGPAIQSVLAGETDMVWDPGLAFQHIQQGKARILAVASDKRPTAFPNVPTMAEAGMPAVTYDAWTGIWVPAGTPPAAIERISKALEKVLADPAVAKRFEDNNAEARFRTTAEFKTMVAAEVKTLSAIIKERNITME